VTAARPSSALRRAAPSLALRVALGICLGVALGVAPGLAARPAPTLAPDASTGIETTASAPPAVGLEDVEEAIAANDANDANTYKADTSATNPPPDQGPATTIAAAPGAATRAAIRADLAEVARADAALAASLEALLRAVRAPALPEGTTRGAIAGTVTRARDAPLEDAPLEGAPLEGARSGGAPLEGVRIVAIPEVAHADRQALPWPEHAPLERDRALHDLAHRVLALRLDAARGGGAESGPDGRYVVPGLPSGAYVVAGAAPGLRLDLEDDEGRAVAPGARVDMVGRASGVVAARVIDEAGRAAAGAHVRAVFGEGSVAAECDERGVATVEVAAGPVEVVAGFFRPGLGQHWAVAALDVAAGGAPALATLRLEAAGVAPPEGEPAPPPEGTLRVRLRDARGLPVARRQVMLLTERKSEMRTPALAESDDDGVARLEMPARVADALDGGAPSALRIAVSGPKSSEIFHLDPEPATLGGERTVVVPDPAVLVVTAPPGRRAAYGGRAMVDLVHRGAPEGACLSDDLSVELPDDGRLILGPVAEGPYTLGVRALRHEDHDAPVVSLDLYLPPGISHVELPPPATRALRVHAPGRGHLLVIEGGAGGPRITSWSGDVAEGHLDLPHAPAGPLVVAFVPAGECVVRACTLVPAGAAGDRGEVTPGSGQGRGLRAAVLTPPSADEDGARLDLRAGDVLLAVDGDPVTDALRPFGDRLAPDAPATPLRLALDRGGRVLEVVAVPASLRAAIAEATALFGPAPPAE